MKFYRVILITIIFFLGISFYLRIPSTIIDSSSGLLKVTVGVVEEELRSRGVKFTPINVYFSEVIDEDSIVGAAYIFPAISWIEIKRSYFNNSSPEIREALILHEYGHVLGLEHDDRNRSVESYPCPVSVMHFKDSMSDCFWRNRDYYYNEIVQKVTK